MKNLKVAVVLKIFLIIYVIFIVGFLISMTLNSVIPTIVMLALLLFVIYALKKFNYETVIRPILNKKLFWFLVTIGIIMRVLLLFEGSYDAYIVSDYAVFYNNAVNFANESLLDEKYIAVFPHLGGYIILLGSIFKLFGSHYLIVVGINIIFDLLCAYVLYRLLKLMWNHKMGMIGVIIWLCNPVNIHWIKYCIPVVLFHLLFMLSCYVFYKTYKETSNPQRFWWYSFLLGVTLAIANVFRPIMVVFIIAIVIVFFYRYITSTRQLKLVTMLIGFAIIFLPYYAIGEINETLISKTIHQEVAQNSYGWSAYVGSDIQGKGSWSSTLAMELQEQLKINSKSASEIQHYFYEKAIHSYKNNGFDNGKHLVSKFSTLTSNIHQLGSAHALFLFMVLSSVLLIPYMKDASVARKVLPYFLLIIGLVLSHLPLEVSPRYMLPLIVPMTITLAIYVGFLLHSMSHVKNEKSCF